MIKGETEFGISFQPHSPTSLAAAEAIEPRVGTLRFNVLAYLRACGAHGATDEEMQEALGMNPSTQRPRRIELTERGFVYGFGTRLTRSRRKAVVWRAELHQQEFWAKRENGFGKPTVK